MKKRISVCLVILLAIALLTACGGASKDSAVVAATTAAAMDYGYAVEETASAYAPGSVHVEEAKSTSGSSGALGGANTVTPTVNSSRKLIRTVHLDVETYDFEGLMTKLEEHITALAGYVEQSDISGNSMQNNYSRRRAYMTVRIPSTNLDQFISSVEADGNVTNKSESTNDVTLQYSDLESRKKSLTIEQDRIWALLEKADTLESVIALEERLSEIRYELESMESRLRLYDNQVEYSTVHVNVEEVKIYTPTAPLTFGERIANGFNENVENMKDFATDLAVLIITSIPIWVPVLLVILIIGFFVKKKAAGRQVKKNLMKFPFKQSQPDQSDSDNP
ncbi:MAG: DUF4349 domain-containing protein [Lachnoclostridium sp.]|nr:DUF4349 domain-containing protein [Lachnoclostridium sp.]